VFTPFRLKAGPLAELVVGRLIPFWRRQAAYLLTAARKRPACADLEAVEPAAEDPVDDRAPSTVLRHFVTAALY
jgi:hypothetical protein